MNKMQKPKKEIKNILIVHGPNLNLLGEREPDIYGKVTLPEINQCLEEFAQKREVQLQIFQSNHEGALIDWIQEKRHWADGMVINPAAYTHYSYALMDCIAALNFPCVEVHLSDIRLREHFRKKSVIKAACVKQISGLGWKSYEEGLRFLIEDFAKESVEPPCSTE